MDTAIEVSFTDLCRICANPSALSRRLPLFGIDCKNLKVLENIRKHLPISVFENDGYPDFACLTCISKINIFDNLLQVCVDANERLKALKTQLELESKSAPPSKENVSTLENTALAEKNLMDIKPDIDLEIKGSYEMMPSEDNSCVTVILPKESQHKSGRSLVLVNVPLDNEQITNNEASTGAGESGTVTAVKKQLNAAMEIELANAASTLMKSNSISIESLRRSSRPRVHNRLYSTDEKADQVLHTCNVCEISFASLKKLNLHQKSHSHLTKAQEKNLVCSKCKQAFDSFSELAGHTCEPQECEFCNIILESEWAKDQHMQLHKGPFTCDFCQATFSNLSVLQNHIQCHTAASTNRRLYQCKMCGKLFKSRIGLHGHEANHTENRLHTCYICQTSFQAKEEMLLHRSKHTKEEKEQQLGDRIKRLKPNPCEVCNKNLSSRAGLEVHMRMHRDEKPFECTECGKHFRQEIKLRYHYRLHFGDLPYSCSMCGKRFNTQRQLDTHTRVHTNERPYICEVCGLGFRSNGVLGRHKQTHSEEPLFNCTHCGKRFRTRHATTVHERSHTEDKRFICDVCGRSFAHKATLDKHRLRHDKQRVQCVDCNVSFATKKGLKRHIGKKHSLTIVGPVQIFETVRSSEYVTLAVPNDELIVEVVV